MYKKKGGGVHLYVYAYIHVAAQAYPLSFNDETQVAVIVARSGLGRVVWWAW